MTLDTGAEVTLISERIRALLGKPVLTTATVKLILTDGRPLNVLGALRCRVDINGSKFKSECHVARSCELLGLDWIQRDPTQRKIFESAPNEVKLVNATEKVSEYIRESIRSKFPEVFPPGLGRCTVAQASFTTKQNTAPTFCKARPVAYALLPKVTAEIERLVEQSVLEPTIRSRYAAPTVIVQNRDGSIRLCADYSTGLNSTIEDEGYPLPTADDIFATLNGGKYFSQLDLAEAYLQIPVEESSQELLTINTVKRLFKFKRLPFGVKTAPSIFQRVMDMLTSDLPGTAAYLDDILVTSESIEEHKARLFRVFERLSRFGFRVRQEKCSFLKQEVKYLGFILNELGREPDPDKTKAIAEMPAPKDISELRAALGMITFYSQFIPVMKNSKAPLNHP